VVKPSVIGLLGHVRVVDGPLPSSCLNEAGRRNGGQQTNCRVNALANAALASGRELRIWYRVTSAAAARTEEARWMKTFGLPIWNRRIEGIA